MVFNKMLSSNPVHGEVSLIQHYVIKFVSDLWLVGGFLDKTLPDETLYGRVGHLYSLLFVTHHLGEETVDPEIIIKVIICLFF
jgi:hypothetical protein